MAKSADKSDDTFISTSVIIPAAGFGKRVGSPEAKELFLDPQTGRPLIDFALRTAKEAGFQPVVVIRPEKRALHRYLIEQNDIEIVLIQGSREWPHTILQARAHWRERNFILLPDTCFSPTSILPEMDAYLAREGQLTFASFAVEDAKTWGVLQVTSAGVEGCEKPQTVSAPRAWGVLGFRQEIGEEFCQALLKSTLDHEWYQLSCQAVERDFEFFKDLTRL